MLNVPTVTHLSIWSPTDRMIDLPNTMALLSDRPNPRQPPPRVSEAGLIAQSRERFLRNGFKPILPNLISLSILPDLENPPRRSYATRDPYTPSDGAELYMTYERALLRFMVSRQSHNTLPDIQDQAIRVCGREPRFGAGHRVRRTIKHDVDTQRRALEELKIWRCGSRLADWISYDVRKMEVWNYGQFGAHHLYFNEEDDSWITKMNPYPGLMPPTASQPPQY